MDWARLITRAAIAFTVTGGSLRTTTGADWESVIVGGLVAAATTVEALIAKSADPTKRPGSPAGAGK